MLEPAQQSRQRLNQHKPKPTGIGAGFEEKQHTRFQMLADKMHARLTHTNGEIDQDVFERFCERILPVTFLNWTCKP